jgi:hypothetical protein
MLDNFTIVGKIDNSLLSERNIGNYIIIDDNNIIDIFKIEENVEYEKQVLYPLVLYMGPDPEKYYHDNREERFIKKKLPGCKLNCINIPTNMKKMTFSKLMTFKYINRYIYGYIYKCESCNNLLDDDHYCISDKHYLKNNGKMICVGCRDIIYGYLYAKTYKSIIFLNKMAKNDYFNYDVKSYILNILLS